MNNRLHTLKGMFVDENIFQKYIYLKYGNNINV